MRAAKDHIKQLADNAQTYTISANKVEMTWQVVHDYYSLHEVPHRRKEFLGIRDLALKESIKDDPLCVARLFLHLCFKDAEWLRYLDILNRKVMQHNEETNRSCAKSHLIEPRKKKDRVPLFSKTEFIVGFAIIIGASNCSERGENLWVQVSQKK